MRVITSLQIMLTTFDQIKSTGKTSLRTIRKKLEMTWVRNSYLYSPSMKIPYYSWLHVIKSPSDVFQDGFATVVSLDDGVVVYITPTISNILGFPKDMLLGRSFIDFVHPKDRMAFASHITCGINFPIGDQSACMQNLQGKKSTSLKK